MSAHQAIIRWKNLGPDFLKRQYPREHTWSFDGGAIVMGSSSPSIVPLPWSNPAGVDPEEAFVASVSSCHMLWFLDVAISAGFEVTDYEDHAEGTMSRNAQGVRWVSKVTLRPRIKWAGERRPTPEEVDTLHHTAHAECFIASSIKSEVVVQTPHD